MNFYKLNWKVIKQSLKDDIILLGIIIPLIALFFALKSVGSIIPK